MDTDRRGHANLERARHQPARIDSSSAAAGSDRNVTDDALLRVPLGNEATSRFMDACSGCVHPCCCAACLGLVLQAASVGTAGMNAPYRTHPDTAKRIDSAIAATKAIVRLDLYLAQARTALGLHLENDRGSPRFKV